MYIDLHIFFHQLPTLVGLKSFLFDLLTVFFSRMDTWIFNGSYKWIFNGSLTCNTPIIPIFQWSIYPPAVSVIVAVGFEWTRLGGVYLGAGRTMLGSEVPHVPFG